MITLTPGNSVNSGNQTISRSTNVLQLAGCERRNGRQERQPLEP